MKRSTAILVTSLLFLSLAFLAYPALAQQPSAKMEEGIMQYRQENYENALKLFEEERKTNPASSIAAFFLGLTQKQLLKYEEAAANLEASITLEPRIKDALVELIDVLYRMGRHKEALQWVTEGERLNIHPAKMAFLKGLLLQQEGDMVGADAAFDRARNIDPTLAQSAEFQKAIGHLKEQELEKARERFQASIQQDPASDLATFARHYVDALDRQLFLQRPIRFTLGLFGQYDTNVVLKPSEDLSYLEPVTDEESYVMSTNFRIDYRPALKGPFLFNAQYSFMSNFHQKHSTTHDLMGNSISVNPGLSVGKSAFTAAFSYSHFLIHGTRYMEYLNVGPLYRLAAGNNSIIEVFGGYLKKNYFRDFLMKDEDRDVDGTNAYVSWIYLFMEDAFLNIKYEVSRERADGVNWDNTSYDMTVNTLFPVTETVKIQLGGGLFSQDFAHTHTVFGVERRDRVYSGTAGIIWECFENARAIAQYSHTNCNSNIEMYDYTRGIYTIGLEYRF